MTVPFDTLQVADRLASGGFTEEQAKTASFVFSDVLKSSFATHTDVNGLRVEIQSFATKDDVAELRHEINLLRHEFRGEISAVRKEIATAIADARADIIRWVFGAIGFQTVLMIGAVAALLKFFK